MSHPTHFSYERIFLPDTLESFLHLTDIWLRSSFDAESHSLLLSSSFRPWRDVGKIYETVLGREIDYIVSLINISGRSETRWNAIISINYSFHFSPVPLNDVWQNQHVNHACSIFLKIKIIRDTYTAVIITCIVFIYHVFWTRFSSDDTIYLFATMSRHNLIAKTIITHTLDKIVL